MGRGHKKGREAVRGVGSNSNGACQITFPTHCLSLIRVALEKLQTQTLTQGYVDFSPPSLLKLPDLCWIQCALLGGRCTWERIGLGCKSIYYQYATSVLWGQKVDLCRIPFSDFEELRGAFSYFLINAGPGTIQIDHNILLRYVELGGKNLQLPCNVLTMDNADWLLLRQLTFFYGGKTCLWMNNEY